MNADISASREGDLGPWCTPAAAARIWQVTAERARQLIFNDHLVPIHVLDSGRRVVRQNDVLRAADLAGPPGQQGRWEPVRAEFLIAQSADGHEVGLAAVPTSWRPGRLSPRARRIAELPWPELVEEYRTGAVTAADIADRYDIGVQTVRRRLRTHGSDLLGRYGTPRAILPITDGELKEQYAAGATLADLAAQYKVSPSLIWRRIHFGDPASP